MPVPIFTHPDCLLHDPGPQHPDTPARLDTLLARAASERELQVVQAPSAQRGALLAVHPETHVARLEAIAARGGGVLTDDTVMSRPSWNAVLGAVGATTAAVTHALEGRGHAFAGARPPGHHALASRAMGFCLVNTVVIAARHAQRAGADRVLIIDWDVHHGNGTQALVEADPSVRYVSLHQHPWYPGTGLESERGVGNVFNVPRPPGLAPERYVGDLWSAITDATTGWAPSVVLVSAGFDAMLGDPLGGFTLEPAHYADLTRRLRERFRDTPIVGVLEGGYAPSRLAEGVVAHALALA